MFILKRDDFITSVAVDLQIFCHSEEKTGNGIVIFDHFPFFPQSYKTFLRDIAG